jgi:hypothetical protein
VGLCFTRIELVLQNNQMGRLDPGYDLSSSGLSPGKAVNHYRGVLKIDFFAAQKNEASYLPSQG